MDKILYILLTIIGIGIFAGCYKDLGNYDYTEPVEIKVTGIDSLYTRTAYTDTLHITPVLEQDDDNYSFFWGIFSSSGTGRIDTLSHSRELKWFITVGSGSYNLVFGARDKKTRIMNLITARLNVETELSTGWYFLKDENNYTNFDVFTDSVKKENVLNVNNSRGIPGKAITMMYTEQYRVRYETDDTTYVKPTAVMFALSDKDIAVMSVNNGEILGQYKDMFYSTPARKAPSDIFMSTNSTMIIINDGKVHTMSMMSVGGSKIGKVGAPKWGKYRITAKIGGETTQALLFDNDSSVFCTPVDVEDELLPIANKDSTLHQLNSDLLYMGGEFIVPKTVYAHAILKSKDTADTYVHLKMDITRPSSGYNNTSLKTLYRDTLDAGLGLVQAQFRAVEQSSGNNTVIYFPKDNHIWSYNRGKLTEKEQAEQLVEGEVTYMQHLRSPRNKTIDYLVVATYSEGNYKVYMFRIYANHLLPDPAIYEGKGRVVKAMYITPGNMSQTPIF